MKRAGVVYGVRSAQEARLGTKKRAPSPLGQAGGTASRPARQRLQVDVRLGLRPSLHGAQRFAALRYSERRVLQCRPDAVPAGVRPSRRTSAGPGGGQRWLAPQSLDGGAGWRPARFHPALHSRDDAR